MQLWIVGYSTARGRYAVSGDSVRKTAQIECMVSDSPNALTTCPVAAVMA